MGISRADTQARHSSGPKGPRFRNDKARRGTLRSSVRYPAQRSFTTRVARRVLGRSTRLSGATLLPEWADEVFSLGTVGPVSCNPSSSTAKNSHVSRAGHLQNWGSGSIFWLFTRAGRVLVRAVSSRGWGAAEHRPSWGLPRRRPPRWKAGTSEMLGYICAPAFSL